MQLKSQRELHDDLERLRQRVATSNRMSPTRLSDWLIFWVRHNEMPQVGLEAPGAMAQLRSGRRRLQERKANRREKRRAGLVGDVM